MGVSIIAQLNYDSNKEIELSVPEEWNDVKIKEVLIKKYGSLDFKAWWFKTPKKEQVEEK